MKNKRLIFLLLLGMNVSLGAQSPGAAAAARKPTTPVKSVDPAGIAATITSSDLQKHLTIIASDGFEGRETGTSGNKKAADYIAAQFKAAGIAPCVNGNSYFQEVAFNWSRWENIGLKANDKDYRHGWDFIAYPTRNSNQKLLETNEVLFLGYGIEDAKYDDYKGVDVKDKVLLVYKGEPMNKKGMSRITGTKELSAWSTDWEKKLETAHNHGARAVLIIENELQKLATETRPLWFGRQVTLGAAKAPAEHFANSYYISSSMAKDLLGNQFGAVVKARKKMQKRGKSTAVTVPVKLALTQEKTDQSLAGENVLGFIEGTDDELKTEIVVITAHYDHLGKRGNDIYNGADDNGSGTSTVIEVAEAFAIAQKQGTGPRRSVLCMLVTGEEKGLLGSQYYTEKPIFPLENTIADINVDMVGRVDEKHADNPNYIYVIGSDRLSTDLHKINEQANANYTNLVLDYTYNAADDPNRYYYRSDHYNFAQKGIPAIFYFNGTHDDYHRTSDTVEKINFTKMETIGRLVFYTAWELANRDERIKVDVKN